MSTAIVNGTPATAWCANCGDTHTRADGKCTRCGAATIRAHTQEAVDVEKHLIAPARPESMPALHRPSTPAIVSNGSGTVKIKLLSTARNRRWMETTLDLIGDFEAEAAAIRKRVGADQVRLAELDRTITTLRGIPRQVDIEESPRHEDDAPNKRRLAPGTWARAFERCVKCGTTEHKHKANGMCTRCHR